MAAVTVISGVQRRRHWSDDQKRAFIAAAFAPGAVVSEVARQADVVPNQIYRWRAQLSGRRAGQGAAFTEVVVEPDKIGAAGAEVVVVELAGARVRVGGAAPPALVAAILGALSR